MTLLLETESKFIQLVGYLVAALLIGYGLFSENGIFFRLVSPPTQTVAKSQTKPAATPSAPVYSLTKTPIKDVKVGTRVPAFDPQLGSEVRAEFAEQNWAQWVKLNLEMIKSDGSLLKMEMLRHEDWVLENIDYEFLDAEDLKATSLLTAANSSQFIKSFPLEAPQVPLRTLFAELQDVRWLMAEVEADSVLATISLDLPEIGVRGEAVVTGVEPCPVILPGPGKVVLTTFHHASSHLIDLYLSPQPPQPPTGVSSPTTTFLASTTHSPTRPLTTFQTSEEALLYPQASRSSNIDPAWERIGVTGNHPIWSEDRHDYIAAMDLRVGERLKNLSGDTVYVQQKLARPGPTPVYNLEVQDEHVYYVGTNGVLAHNVGKDKKGCARDEDGEFYGNNTPSSVDNRWMSKYDPQGHHPVPQFLGGHDNQVLHSLSSSDHSAFHTMLNHALKNGGFNGLDGNSKTDDWIAHFTGLPGEQSRALGILRQVSASFDRSSGTHLRQLIRHNLKRGRLNRY